jgi:hypothetical protein
VRPEPSVSFFLIKKKPKNQGPYAFSLSLTFVVCQAPQAAALVGCLRKANCHTTALTDYAKMHKARTCGMSKNRKFRARERTRTVVGSWVIQKYAAVGQKAFDVSPEPRQSAFKNKGLLLRLWPFKSAKENCSFIHNILSKSKTAFTILFHKINYHTGKKENLSGRVNNL